MAVPPAGSDIPVGRPAVTAVANGGNAAPDNRTDLEQIMGTEPGSDSADLLARFHREYGAERTPDSVKRDLLEAAYKLDFPRGGTLADLRQMISKALPGNAYAGRDSMLSHGIGYVTALMQARQSTGPQARTPTEPQDGVDDRRPPQTDTPIARYTPVPTAPGGGRPTTVATERPRPDATNIATLASLRGNAFEHAVPGIVAHWRSLDPGAGREYVAQLYARLGENERLALMRQATNPFRVAINEATMPRTA